MKTIVAALSLFFLVSLFLVNATSSAGYDPQYDFDNDGDIDIYDVVKVADRYGSTGTPANDTDISELLDKINSLNSSLLELQERLDNLEGFIYREPINAILGDGRYYYETLLLTLDVDSKLGFQDTAQIAPGENVTVNIAFDVWERRGSIIKQVFLICSWTPTWPPPSGYYYALYQGIPELLAGTARASFNITAPINPGNYSVWFCAAEQYTMDDAVGTFTQQPTLPPLIQVIVENP